MDISRREFLGGAAALTAALALRVEPRRIRGAALGNAHCAVLDLGDACALPESRRGYESALADANVGWARVPAHSIGDVGVVIVPAAMVIPFAVARATSNALDAGATVIVESGAAFVAPASRAFRAHRDALRDSLQIEVDEPVSLWPREGRSRATPYVEYTWPVAASVRDFSRVVPLRSSAGEVIGRVDGMPVAIHRCHGHGTLVVLGSPLGPGLLAGDAEATRWLLALIGSPS